jgi:endoglucanase
MKRARFLVAVLVLTVFCASSAQAAISVTYNINTDVNRTPISKYVYGTNWVENSDSTITRSGGNRLTAYNWENNFSNAGNDWYYSNDNLLVNDLPPSQQLIPGIAITRFHDSALAAGQASIVTLQMAGYVSADGNGDVNLVTETAPSARFKKVVFAKGSAFCSPPGSPDINDANVYMDEFVNFLVSKYGHAGDPNGVKFYDLDNEPDLWSSTHKEVHPTKPTCVEYKNKSVAMSIAVKNVDPNAKMLGPVSYGFNGYYSFQDANDWKAPLSTGYSWFLDYYLDKMEANSVTAGKRLLDALDVHWYPEARDGNITALDGNRIVDVPSIYSRANCNARMQAPRSLWDVNYHEVSWIEKWQGSWLPILPPLQNSINTYYPDTNLTITEYAYGGEDHYSGGIATADVLGIFGKYGVHIANYWGDGNYVRAAFKMFRNYDFRSHSTFGDINVPATRSSDANNSIYASIFGSDTNVLHLIVINKNFDNDINASFTITSSHNYASGRVWAFDANGWSITERTPIRNITGNSFTYTIPHLSVCHIVLDGPPCPLQSDLTGDCRVDLEDLDVFCNQWLNAGDCSADPNCADLDGNFHVDFGDFAALAQEWRS